MQKKIILIILVVLILFLSNGCWGKRELNELGLVTATGFDLEKHGKIRATVLVTIPRGKSASGSSENPNTAVVSATGDGFMDATKNLRAPGANKLVWFHSDIIIIGEELARKGVKAAIGFLLRNREIRANSVIIVSKGRADKIMETPAIILDNLSSKIDGMISIAPEWSKAYFPSLQVFAISILDKKKGALAGRLETMETSRQLYSTNTYNLRRLPNMDKKLSVTLSGGSSIFKEDKLVGWLDPKATRGYLWIKGQVKGGALTVPGPKGKGLIAIELKNSTSKITAKVLHDKVIMDVIVKVKSSIAGVRAKVDFADRTDMVKIQNLFKNGIIAEMKYAVREAKKHEADIFDFGGQLNKSRPREWKKREKDWDKIFPEVIVRYNVEVSIAQVGDITQPIF